MTVHPTSDEYLYRSQVVFQLYFYNGPSDYKVIYVHCSMTGKCKKKIRK